MHPFSFKLLRQSVEELKYNYVNAVQIEDEIHVVCVDENRQRLVKRYPAEYVMYYDDENGTHTTIFGSKVSKLSTATGKEFYKCKRDLKKAGVRLWESDISPIFRCISKHFYEVETLPLNITLFDIEVDYDKNVSFKELNATARFPVNSISLTHYWTKETYVAYVEPEGQSWPEDRLQAEIDRLNIEYPPKEDINTVLVRCESEVELLLWFLDQIKDSHVLGQFNGDLFDLPYLARRIASELDGHPLSLDFNETVDDKGEVSFKYIDDPNVYLKDKEAFKFTHLLDDAVYGGLRFRIVTTNTNDFIEFVGHTVDFNIRIKSDYLSYYKKFEAGEQPSYKLEAISDIVNVDKEGNPVLPKINYEGTLADLYHNDFPMFIRYSIRDTEILSGFEDRLGYIALANEYVHSATGNFNQIYGTIGLADCASINYCHYERNQVVPDIKNDNPKSHIDGAFVLYPQVGEHTNIGSIDIGSLYPNSIRTVNISPETLTGQFVERVKAHDAIMYDKDIEITLKLESTGEFLKMSAREWKQTLKDLNWSVSGYGTTFTQDFQGFMPSIITMWIAVRKKYKKLMAEHPVGSEMYKYYDRLQYVYKIRLNSFYGAMNNRFFRFYDPRLGNSTTSSGRQILLHQCRKVNEFSGGDYNVDFPLYADVAAAMEGHDMARAKEIALNDSIVDGVRIASKFQGHYPAEHVIYGDTDSTYFKLGEGTEDELFERSRAAEKYVNDSFPEFLMKTFLCIKEFSEYVKTECEIISDRGIFVSKKRYMLHIVNNDGKKVDKMKIMGLDTIRTSIPKFVSSKINNTLKQYLKSGDWRTLEQTIVDFKEYVRKDVDFFELGIPSGINKLAIYDREYRHDPKTRLPSHIAGAILFNDMRKLYDDNASPEIVSGMKVKRFVLRTPYKRFTSICIPMDIEQLPEWLDDFPIDRSVMVEKLVDAPLNNILVAIDRKTPSASNILFEDLFD